MSYTCRYCGATVGDTVKFCPNCGASLVAASGSGYTDTSYTNSNYTSGNYTNNVSDSTKDGLKTAAIAGGTALGVSALTNMARRVTHRRRPPYMGPVMGGGRPPMGPPPGGRGGPGGPGGHGGRMM